MWYTQKINNLRMRLTHPAAPGCLLFLFALLALVVDNTPFDTLYHDFFTMPVTLGIGSVALSKSVLVWINDGLMSLFFLSVGLEIKREIKSGHLSKPGQVALPLMGALGGMVVPALVYIGMNLSDPQSLTGWAVPVATDIAFALGILYLIGSRIPATVKALLTAIAVFDDLGAIVIIGFFYTQNLALPYLALALMFLLGLALLNRLKVNRLSPYLMGGLFLWFCVLKSGLHPTCSAVLLAFVMPMDPQNNVSERLEQTLHPWVVYLILPLFAFANSGISLETVHWQSLSSSVSLGVFLGLFLGKPLGVFSGLWLTIKSNTAKRPSNVTWMALCGISVLCGIGFTMSLFIGALAFDGLGDSYATWTRTGVLLGSFFSGVLGWWMLRRAYAPFARPCVH